MIICSYISVMESLVAAKFKIEKKKGEKGWIKSSTLTLWKASLAESCKFLKHLVLISV